MNDSAERAISIFGEALALPESERAAYLSRACAGDAKLRERIDGMLKVEDDAAQFFGGLEDRTRNARARFLEEPGKWIDRYLLHEQIGEGGCGVVYRAEQEQPVQREVALKIIKLGMDTKEVVARFGAERQALALMDHPNIARVFDAGATETGRPYFVMELVRGTKFTDYCDQQRLSIPQRLDLFVQVCRAIQHAHQKGVIHRDIKPSNILISVQDGAAVPKVIDFGIAKATQGRLARKTVFTAAEQFIGTPAYMSPEQAERGGIDIDTRSDIYSLGVLLYELITSRTPFDSATLHDLGVDAIRQTIREKEPARPSIRLGELSADQLTAAAANRHTDPARLIAAIRGDLDWIVIKCLEKDRSRRFETVNALVRDIGRHLDSEPVAARPPSRVDRFRKTVRRNKLAVGAGAAVLAALVLGCGVSTWMFFREKDARRLAQAATEQQEQLRIQAETARAQAEKDRSQAELDRSRAEKEAARNRELAQSLQQLLQRYGPGLTRDRAELRRMVDQVTADGVADPKNTAVWRQSAYIRGCIGQFSEAGAVLKRLIELTPDDSEIWHWQTAILLQTQQHDACREHCRQALQRFQNTQDRFTAERIAKDCLLLPGFEPDRHLLNALLKTALSADGPQDEMGWAQLAKGMAEYRAGNFEEALNWLSRVTSGRNPYLDVQTKLVMAMAMKGANRPTALPLFHATAAELKSNLPPLSGPQAVTNWMDGIITEVLLQEAREVIVDSAAGL